jgi:hypothetical protein
MLFAPQDISIYTIKRQIHNASHARLYTRVFGNNDRNVLSLLK